MTQTDIYRVQSWERDMDGTIGELLKQGDPDINTRTLKGENLGIKGMINYEATSEVCLCMCDLYICAHVCIRACA